VVLTDAIKQARAWRQAGHHLPVAVNVSMDDLIALDFPDMAASLAASVGDDFGTGHSSLAQLRDLPFNELKVDRGFVHGASIDGTRGAICSASLRMAHELQIQVVGEGIEDQDDWNFLAGGILAGRWRWRWRRRPEPRRVGSLSS
jgi:EAL domain-containing protein (putative c-di-GMP-specific phosphodiesterase class I)